MKYINLFETFDLPEKVNFTSRNLGDIVEYFFQINNYKFRVNFKLDDDDITWERTYKLEKDNSGYTTFEGEENMPKKIVSVVTYITNDFIVKYNPDIIYINHILMETKDKETKIVKKRETMSSSKINKRARINYTYLKTLNIIKNGEYGLKYFNFINSTEGYTACYIYNKKLENKLNNLFSNLVEINSEG